MGARDELIGLLRHMLAKPGLYAGVITRDMAGGRNPLKACMRPAFWRTSLDIVSHGRECWWTTALAIGWLARWWLSAHHLLAHHSRCVVVSSGSSSTPRIRHL